MDDILDTWLRNELQKVRVSLSPADVETIVAWAGTARVRQPVAFIGAGMSLNAKPVARWREIAPERSAEPTAATWTQLSAIWQVGLGGDGADSGQSDPLWLAELYEQRHGRPSLIQSIRLSVPEELLEPGDAHLELARIGWHAVVTTNYDRLLERAFKNSSSPRDLRVVVRDSELTDLGMPSDRLLLLHPHGTLDRPETMTITLENYRRFPAEHPGMQVKVRQLLMEHPLLVLGFSALDPNFVQWQGWLSDFMGPAQLPGLSIVVGSSPSIAWKSYWGSRLKFVVVKSGEELGQLLAVIGRYLVDDNLIGPQLIKRIIEAASLDELLSVLDRALRWHEHRGHLADHKTMGTMLESSIRRAAQLKCAKDDVSSQRAANQIIELILRLQPESSGAEVDAASRAGLPSASRTSTSRLDALRSLFSDKWLSWVDIVARYRGPRFWIGDFELNVDVRNELEHFGTAKENTCFGRLWALVHAGVFEAATTGGGLAAAVEHCDRERPQAEIGDDERKSRQDALARASLRVGALAGLDAELKGIDAQSMRRRGFHFVLAGQIAEAGREYTAAARLSRDENESEAVQRLTLETARGVYRVGLALDEGASNTGRLDLDSDLLARLKELERHSNPEYDQFEHLEHGLAKEVAATLEPLLDSPDAWDEPSLRFGSTAESLVRWCEGLWIRPDIAGRAAEALAIEQLRGRNRTGAIYRLVTYGSERLSKLMARFVRRRGSAPLQEEEISALLAEGRWPGEWLARLEAMPSWLTELPESRLAEAEHWLQQCADALLRPGARVSRPGAIASHDFTIPGKIAEAVRTICANAAPEYAIARWTWWSRTLPTEPRYHRLVSEIGAKLGTLPWPSWLERSLVRLAEVDALLSAVTDQLANVPPWRPGDLEEFIGDMVGKLMNRRQIAPLVSDFPKTYASLSRLAAAPGSGGRASNIRSFQLRNFLSLGRDEIERTATRAELGAEAVRLLETPADLSSFAEAVHCVAWTADAHSSLEWQDILGRAKSIQAVSGRSHQLFPRTDRRDRAGALSHLGVRLASAGPAELSTQALDLLLVAWSLDQTVVPFALDVPTGLFATIRAEVVERIAMMFPGLPSDGLETPDSLRLACCDAVRRWACPAPAET